MGYEYERLPKDTFEYEMQTAKLEALRQNMKINTKKLFVTMDNGIYDSLHIEGNALTRNEITYILEHDVTIRGASSRDYLQAKNYIDALALLKEWIMRKECFDINEDTIKEIHYLLTKDELSLKESGQYRQEPVHIRFTDYIPPDEYSVPEHMQELCDIYNRSKNHPFVFDKICEFKRNFERIHPFIDGNGRTGRFLMNLMLLQNGYGYFSAPFHERDLYFKSLDDNTFHEYAVGKVITNMEEIREKYHEKQEELNHDTKRER